MNRYIKSLLSLYFFVNVAYYPTCSATNGLLFQLPIHDDTTYELYLQRTPLTENHKKLTLRHFYECRYNNFDFLRTPSPIVEVFSDYNSSLSEYCDKHFRTWMEVKCDYEKTIFTNEVVNGFQQCIKTADEKIASQPLAANKFRSLKGEPAESILPKISITDALKQCLKDHYVQRISYTNPATKEIIIKNELEIIEAEKCINNCITGLTDKRQQNFLYGCSSIFGKNMYQLKSITAMSEMPLAVPSFRHHHMEYYILEVLYEINVPDTTNQDYKERLYELYYDFIGPLKDEFDIKKCHKTIKANAYNEMFRQIQFSYHAFPKLDGIQTHEEFTFITKEKIKFMSTIDCTNKHIYEILDQHILEKSEFDAFHVVAPILNEHYEIYLKRAKLLNNEYPLTKELWVKQFQSFYPGKLYYSIYRGVEFRN